MRPLAFLGPATAALLLACAPPPAVDRHGNVQVRPASQNLQAQGLQLFQEYKKKKPLSRNGARNTQLRRVGKQVSAVVDLPGARWEFVVFEDDTPNAFALPGGKVGVNSGLFAITRNDAGLAAVVAHEIAHVTSNHAEYRLQQSQAIAVGGLILDAVLAAESASTRQAAGQVYGTGATLGARLPFSRTQELEADRIGMIFMAKAGYDPREAVALWKRFSAYNRQQGGQGTEFLRTHPIDSTRIKALEEFLPVALRHYRR